jgi:thiol-disulfide isomerase/thioredoxin
MDKSIRNIVIVCAVVLAGIAVFLAVPLLTSPAAPASTTTTGPVIVYYFYGEECPHCHEIMPFIDNLTAKYPDVEFRKLETWHNQTNQKLSVNMNTRLAIRQAGVPEIIVGDVALIGSKEISDKLEAVILEQKKK